MTVIPECSDLTIVVDAANVVGARADGWWKDRAGAALRLCQEVVAVATRGLATGELPAGVLPGPQARCFPTWVIVLEGRAREAADSLCLEAGSYASHQILAASGGLARLVLASGPGDDTIVGEASDLPGRCVVTTADRELRRRCEEVGAVVAGPRWLLRLL